MRQPLLRILVALLLGMWIPLCCCQAMALAGDACGSTPTPQAKADSCCQGCHAAPSDQESTPDDDKRSLPSDCTSCPSCQGTSAGAGLTVETKLPTLEQNWNAAAAMALVVLTDLPKPDAAISPGLPSRWDDRLFIKANREAQRWFCALIV